MPVNQVAFLQDVKIINARTLDDYQLKLAVRVIFVKTPVRLHVLYGFG